MTATKSAYTRRPDPFLTSAYVMHRPLSLSLHRWLPRAIVAIVQIGSLVGCLESFGQFYTHFGSVASYWAACSFSR